MFYSTINMVFEDCDGRKFGAALLKYDISPIIQMIDYIHMMKMLGCKYVTAYVVIDNE